MTFTPNFLLGQINKALAEHSGDLPLDLSSLRRIICGGEAIVSATARRFLQTLAPLGLARDVVPVRVPKHIQDSVREGTEPPV